MYFSMLFSLERSCCKQRVACTPSSNAVGSRPLAGRVGAVRQLKEGGEGGEGDVNTRRRGRGGDGKGRTHGGDLELLDAVGPYGREDYGHFVGVNVGAGSVRAKSGVGATRARKARSKREVLNRREGARARRGEWSKVGGVVRERDLILVQRGEKEQRLRREEEKAG